MSAVQARDQQVASTFPEAASTANVIVPSATLLAASHAFLATVFEAPSYWSLVLMVTLEPETLTSVTVAPSGTALRTALVISWTTPEAAEPARAEAALDPPDPAAAPHAEAVDAAATARPISSVLISPLLPVVGVDHRYPRTACSKRRIGHPTRSRRRLQRRRRRPIDGG
jgi:hypothetical protein